MTNVIGKCAACHKDVEVFKDKASYTEWLQSKFCQECQDSVFGGAFTCENCGGETETPYRYEQHVYCSAACFQHDVGF